MVGAGLSASLGRGRRDARDQTVVWVGSVSETHLESVGWLLVLVAWVFWWLNLWGEERFDVLRERLLHHPWRLPKEVTYLFDWIAHVLRLILHPRPKWSTNTG